MFSVATDVVAFTIVDEALAVLLIERGGHPDAAQRGVWALPGGFVGAEEDLAAAAARELGEETGVGDVTLEQLATYGEPERDPRGRIVSVAYLAVLGEPVALHAGSDASRARWVPISEAAEAALAFDHAAILADGLTRLRSKLEYTALAVEFLPDTFSIGQLRGIYETVWGCALDPGNFQRKVRSLGADFVEPVEGAPTGSGRGRPAQPFRALKRGTEALDHPFVRVTLTRP